MEQVRSFCGRADRSSVERRRGYSVRSRLEGGGWQARREGAISDERLPGPRFAGGLDGDLWLRESWAVPSSSGIAECPQDMEVAKPGESERLLAGG